MKSDLLIVGAGPAGSACAIHAAKLGMRVRLIERASFPRDKVCGDCLTPRALPLLDQLGVREAFEKLPSVALQSVRFVDTRSRSVEIELKGKSGAEVAVKRSVFDAMLLEAAREAGVEVEMENAVSAVRPGWILETAKGIRKAEVLIAADGRNSTVARLLGLLPGARRDRIAVQAHVPARAGWEKSVGLILRPEGYCGVAPVDSETLNLCLVAKKAGLTDLKKWADQEFEIPSNTEWRSIAPLAREAVTRFPARMLGVGDVCRVVEPFTGEGITHALAGGIAAAEAIDAEPQWPDIAARYAYEIGQIYLGRLWVNRLAKYAVENPAFGNGLIAAGRRWPGLLKALTAKVVD